MRFLTCGADGILVELADLDETLRVFAALQSAVKHAVEQTAESPERAAQPSTTSVFAGVKQLIPAARTVYVAFDPLLSSRVELTAAIRALNVAADMERHSRMGKRRRHRHWKNQYQGEYEAGSFLQHKETRAPAQGHRGYYIR